MDKSKRLCVLIPALNEEATIADVIGRIPRNIPQIDELKVLVVDDGSTDRTCELARAAGAEVISHHVNMGVGRAFQTGLQRALELGADYMVNMDGDGQFDPADITKLLQPLLDREADFVTTSRFLTPDVYPQMSKVKFWGNQMIARLISSLCGKRYYDVSCGFRAYTRDALLQLNLFGQFTYTQETFLDLSMKGLSIREVPLKIRGVREFGKSRVASNLFRYAVNTSKIIFRTYRDYKPLRFFGALSLLLLAVSLLLMAFFVGHYLLKGTFSPHLWAGFSAAYLLGVSILSFIVGLLADMLTRIRMNQERMLYMMKKGRFPQD